MISTELRRFTAATSPRPDAIPTGIRALDLKLGGGLLLGQLIEISGGISCGKASLALRMALWPLWAGEAVAWIDPLGRFYPLPALEAGAPLRRLFVIRLHEEKDPTTSALRAAQIVLSSPGAVTLLVLRAPPAFRASSGALLKLQRLCERSRASLIFLTEHTGRQASLGAAISLRLHLRRTAHRSAIEILRHKWGATGTLPLEEPFSLFSAASARNPSFPL
jgi:RecA/RadA recombinase